MMIFILTLYNLNYGADYSMRLNEIKSRVILKVIPKMILKKK